jgi:dihydrofolate reductase
MHITAVLAMDSTRLIGNSNKLPWHIPEDLKRFQQFTKWNIVVMGKNTYYSIPASHRPLPNRRNIVLTREPIEWVECYSTIDNFLIAMEKEQNTECCIIGWATVYDKFFSLGLVDTVELTLIDGSHDGDIFVAEFRSNFHEVSSLAFPGGKFITLQRN